MSTTIKERINEFIAYKKLSIRQFEKNCGLSNGYMRQLVDRPSTDKLMQILEAYPELNKVLAGEGEMLDDIKKENETNIGNPIVDDFVGSLGSYIGDGNVALTDDNIRDRMSIPGLRDKSIVYLPVAGDSMIDRDNPENSIPDGAMVAVSPALLSTFRWGEVYALVTPEGVVVKKVMPGDGDHIRCESFNSEKYPTYELCSDEVLSAWRVVGVVSVRYR